VAANWNFLNLLCLPNPVFHQASESALSTSFGTDLPSVGFGLVPGWKRTSQPMARKSQKAPMFLVSGASNTGIQLQCSNNKSSGLTNEDMMHLAQATQSHLEALFMARHRWSSWPVPPRPDHLSLRIVYSCSRSAMRLSSLSPTSHISLNESLTAPNRWSTDSPLSLMFRAIKRV
jgi:hypothetical protein